MGPNPFKSICSRCPDRTPRCHMLPCEIRQTFSQAAGFIRNVNESKPNSEYIGCYAFFDEDDCLYVGQTQNIKRRVSQHVAGSGTKFFQQDQDDKEISLIWWYCDLETLNGLESFLYDIFQPTENIARPPRGEY